MFLVVYEVCLVIFVGQEIAWPFALALSGYAAWAQAGRVDRLKAEMDEKGAEAGGNTDEISRVIKGLPKLKPLKCPSCGTGVLLRAADTCCPSCQRQGALPPEYAEATALRAQVRTLVRRALWNWRAARTLTARTVGGLFLLGVFVEPMVIFPVSLIGANMFSNTWIDRLFEKTPHWITYPIMGMSFLGFIVLIIVFLMLWNLSKTLRRNLPAPPVLPPEARGRETGNCRACGGGIEYGAGDFACACPYCHVVNFRVAFTQQAVGQSRKQRAEAKGTLFAAMDIIDEFCSSFFIIVAILSVGCGLLVAYAAVKKSF